VINPSYFSNSTIEYILEIYSSDEFISSYSTNNPLVFCIGAVAIILFTTFLFFLYDFCVRKEFHNNRNLFEAKRQFVRYVSHEVRTPLNTVCMGLTLLQDDFATCLGTRRGDNKRAGEYSNKVPNQEQVEDWMRLSNQVYQNAEAAVAVLTDLLNYDKIQMGTLTLELAVIPVWNTVQRTVSEFNIAAMEKKVNMELDFSPLVQSLLDVESGNKVDKVSGLPAGIKDCMVVGDNIRLSQVLRNLISNGLKFTNEHGECSVFLYPLL
jgi:signal transduction histidine kinase